MVNKIKKNNKKKKKVNKEKGEMFLKWSNKGNIALAFLMRRHI